MSALQVKTALGVSVALNIFALAAGATIFVRMDQLDQRLAETRTQQAASSSPMSEVVDRLDPTVREQVRSTLRASALRAKPDFEEARRKRREAVALAAASGFEAGEVRRLLEESRLAEGRGRARLEADAVALLGTLEVKDRAVLSQILTRRGRSTKPPGDAPGAETSSSEIRPHEPDQRPSSSPPRSAAGSAGQS